MKNKFTLLLLIVGFLYQCQTPQPTNNEPAQAKGFTVSGRKLIDANGNEFVIKGVNHPIVWFKETAYNAMDDVARKNNNAVRIVWDTNGDLNLLDKTISKCIELKMIPIVELHDATGDSTKTKLLEMASYFTKPNVKTIIDKYSKYIMINIANEWGNHSVTSNYWLDAYKAAIDTIRNAGYEQTIWVDAPGWGQNIYPIIEFGNELIKHDRKQNILFDIHMYGSWNNVDTLNMNLQKVYDSNLPLVVGEFGYNHNNGDNNLGCKVNHKAVIAKCNELGYGYMPWSWTGNNKENAWLDLVDIADWQTLTTWGQEIYQGQTGITATARKASVFE